jgi:hypothetical protein
VIVVFSNYQVLSIFKTDDGGSTWTPVSGNLEENSNGSGNGPSVRWVAILPLSGGTTAYFAAASTGLYSTRELNGMSTNWVQEGASTIGNVVVDMVKTRQSDRLIAVATHGGGIYSSNILTGIAETSAVLPDQFALSQNYPNPFNPVTQIPFSIPKAVNVNIEIFNLLGQRVAVLVNEHKPGGFHTVEFDGSSLSGGMYLYRLRAGDFRQVRKMLLVR